MATVDTSDPSASNTAKLRTIVLKTMTPSQRDPFNATVLINLDSTIEQLKAMIKDTLEIHPDYASQRIIYQGRQLTDTLIIRDVVGTTIAGNDSIITFHLVIRPTESEQQAQIAGSSQTPRLQPSHQASTGNTPRQGSPQPPVNRHPDSTNPLRNLEEQGNRLQALQEQVRQQHQHLHQRIHNIQHTINGLEGQPNPLVGQHPLQAMMPQVGPNIVQGQMGMLPHGFPAGNFPTPRMLQGQLTFPGGFPNPLQFPPPFAPPPHVPFQREELLPAALPSEAQPQESAPSIQPSLAPNMPNEPPLEGSLPPSNEPSAISSIDNSQPAASQTSQIGPQVNASLHSRQSSVQFGNTNSEPQMNTMVTMPSIQMWGQMPQIPQAQNPTGEIRNDGTEVRTIRESYSTTAQGQLQRVREETRQYFAVPGGQIPISTQTTRTVTTMPNHGNTSSSNQATTTTTITSREGTSSGLQIPTDSPNLPQRANPDNSPRHAADEPTENPGQRATSNQQYYLVMGPSGPRALLLGPQQNQVRSQLSPYVPPQMYPMPPVFPANPLPQFNLPPTVPDTNGQVPVPQQGVPLNPPLVPDVPGALPNPPMLAAWAPDVAPGPAVIPAPEAAINPNRELNANEIAARLNQAFEHLGLVMRLAVAVLVCTGGPDWTRNAIVWSLAIAIFFYQTGLLNPYIAPVIAYLNGFLPDAAQVANAQPHNQRQDNTNPPNPQDTARRLIQQDNARRLGRMRDVFRSIERGLWLFVASFIPGLGERVGEVRVARERAEQQQQEPAEGDTNIPENANPEPLAENQDADVRAPEVVAEAVPIIAPVD